MNDKVYMPQMRSTVVCPKCLRKTLVDFSDADLSGTKEISLQCTCGHSYTTSMERRRHYRKPVNFKGRYQYSNHVELVQGSGAGKFVGKGKMNILDVSAWGLKVKLKKKETLQLNDQLSVELHLDDKERTFIREKATIKNINERYIGGAFTERRKGNRSLGFYLLG
jgi:hypothetical protein